MPQWGGLASERERERVREELIEAAEHWGGWRSISSTTALWDGRGQHVEDGEREREREREMG